MTAQVKAYIAAILYSFIIGFSLLFVKITLSLVSPLDTLAHRFTCAFIFVLIPVLLGKARVQMTWRGLLTILPLILMQPILFFMLQAFGLVYISSSEAGIMQATVPIFTLLLAAVVLKERANGKQAFSVFLSVAGISYIFLMNGVHVDLSNFKGSFFILLSALAFAGYNVLARLLTKQYSLFTLTFFMTLFGFITFNTMAISQHLLNNSLGSFFVPWTSASFLLAIIYLGVMATVVSVFLSIYALANLEAYKMSVFTNFSTLIAILAGVIVLNESIRFYHLLGTLMIIAGVIGTNYFGHNDSKEKPKKLEE